MNMCFNYKLCNQHSLRGGWLRGWFGMGRDRKQRSMELTDRHSSLRYWSQISGAYTQVRMNKDGAEGFWLTLGRRWCTNELACFVAFLRICPGFQKQPLAQNWDNLSNYPKNSRANKLIQNLHVAQSWGLPHSKEFMPGTVHLVKSSRPGQAKVLEGGEDGGRESYYHCAQWTVSYCLLSVCLDT